MTIGSHAVELTALITLLAGLLYFTMLLRVGNARTKHNVEAPAVTGNPVFERTYRVQMNTLEQFPIFLPALWLATLYFAPLPWLPAALGALWLIGRLLYMQAYISDPKKRGPGFGLSALAQLALVLIACYGLGVAWFTV